MVQELSPGHTTFRGNEDEEQIPKETEKDKLGKQEKIHPLRKTGNTH